MEFLNEDKRSWKDLTDEEKGLLLLAYYEGKVIQEWCEYDWYDDCLSPDWADGIWRIKPEAVKQVRWCNDYKDGSDVWHYSREAADRTADENRIAVIRREIVDGVVSYFKEDV